MRRYSTLTELSILDYVRASWDVDGHGPRRSDVAAYLGLSTSRTEGYLWEMAAAGLLTWDFKRPYTLREANSIESLIGRLRTGA